ncbi:MAG: DUF4156 domain-containing protein [Agitococcus sp.]|nr:DUF4156 domain-containing protein [Agitococcus sp.]
MKKILICTVVLCCLSACSAIPVENEAARIDFVSSVPNKCASLGEIVGTQGNWFTSDVTPDANLMLGARNQLKNKASLLGANVVVIEDKNHSGRGLRGGMYNSSVVGHAYLCMDRLNPMLMR